MILVSAGLVVDPLTAKLLGGAAIAELRSRYRPGDQVICPLCDQRAILRADRPLHIVADHGAVTRVALAHRACAKVARDQPEKLTGALRDRESQTSDQAQAVFGWRPDATPEPMLLIEQTIGASLVLGQGQREELVDLALASFCAAGLTLVTAPATVWIPASAPGWSASLTSGQFQVVDGSGVPAYAQEVTPEVASWWAQAAGHAELLVLVGSGLGLSTGSSFPPGDLSDRLEQVRRAGRLVGGSVKLRH